MLGLISFRFLRIPFKSKRHFEIMVARPAFQIACPTVLQIQVNSSGVGFEPSRTRTCDPLVKSQLLYQLSYRPIYMQRAREGVLF